jgi:hypothetical protein
MLRRQRADSDLTASGGLIHSKPKKANETK